MSIFYFNQFIQVMRRSSLLIKLSVLSILLLALAGCITPPQTADEDRVEPAIGTNLSEKYKNRNNPTGPKDRKVTEAYVSYIVKNYSISKKGARRIVEAVTAESKTYKVDKSLITAVIAIESRFNPYALSKSNAEGLMQIIPRWHPEKMAKIGGEEQIVETRHNIAAGTLALKECLVKHNQNVALALQQYNGSLFDTKRKYSNKVLAEKRRIDQWVATIN